MNKDIKKLQLPVDFENQFRKYGKIFLRMGVVLWIGQILLGLGLIGFVLYIVYHFVSKFW